MFPSLRICAMEEGRYEIINIDITRNTEIGEPGSTPLSALTEIAGKIRDIADSFPSYIFYYFCDNTQEIPAVSSRNSAIPVQEYRNRLFSAMFQRHCTEEWIDTEIRIGEDFIHLLYRQTEEPYIMELRKMIEDEGNEILSQK